MGNTALLPILLQSKLQRDNPPLFQVIRNLIDTSSIISGGAATTGNIGPPILPPGGSTGQILQKTSSADYATAWANPVGTGDVIGPISSVDNSIALFNGTTGKLLKDASQVTINPTHVIM